MLVDLTCPAEVFRAAPPTEDIPAVTLTLFNLSDRVIASAEVSLRLLDAGGNETEQLSFRGRALNGRPHSTFMMTVPCAPGSGSAGIEATLAKVWFADNEVWRRDPAREIEYMPNALPVSVALTNLKFTAGETAVGYPSRQNGLWVCVCGRPNPETADVCARCGRDRDLIFAQYSPETVEAQVSMRERQLDLTSRSMREDTIRLQRIREEEYKQKKLRRRRRCFLAGCLAGALALIAGILFFAAPAIEMLAGRRLLESGKAEEAKALFESLGDFGGAREMVSECEWQTALSAADSAVTVEDLAKAGAALRAIADRPEALKKADETDLIRSRMLLDLGDRQGAEEALALVPEDNESRALLLLECRKAEARELLNARDYAGARQLYLTMTEDPEARDLAAECLYLPARELMAKRKWQEALDTLTPILDYRNSRYLSLECHYHLAQNLEEAGDLTGACDEYLMAGDWSDAWERLRGLTYRIAADLLDKGDARGAQPLFASIPDYKDANEQEQRCRYLMAEKAANNLEYSLVLELLDGIPDEFENTGEMRAEACYQRAKALAGQGDWAAAAELLRDVDLQALTRRHRDARQLYQIACEQAGLGSDSDGPDPDVSDTPVPETPTETPSPDSFLVTEDDEP